MKVKSFKDISRSSVNLLLVILLLASVASWRGQILGSSLKEVLSGSYSTDIDLASCRQFFPEAYEVRYAWSSNPEGANLYNKEGLPASIFKTKN